jgi:hypothetical protein
MKLLPHLVAISAILLLQGVQAKAQEPNKLPPETKVVLRISREFIHELMAKQFERDEPIAKNSFGALVQGCTHVAGRFDVKLQRNTSAIDFDFIVRGEVLTDAVATRRLVQVYGHGVAEFSGRRHVVFDGNVFLGQAIEMNATYHSSIDQVRSFRGGLSGSLTRSIALPSLRRNLRESDQEAENDLSTRLRISLEKETDRLISTMNKFGPLLNKVEEIMREQKLLSARSVQHYLATTEEHVYLGIGPLDRRIPSLPKLEVSKRRPIELWIAKDEASPDDLRNSVLQHWDIAKPFLLQRIGRDSQELAKIVEQVQVEIVEGWFVMTIDPKILSLKLR